MALGGDVLPAHALLSSFHQAEYFRGGWRVKYRTVMTVAALAMILAGLAFGLEGPTLIHFYGISQPPGFTEPNMSFYRMRSFSFVAGMILFGFGLVTWQARKITDTKLQKSMALGYSFAYLMAGSITLSQQTALWGTRAGWFSVEFFYVFACVFGYLKIFVLWDGAPKPKPAFSEDSESLRERWKREIGNAAAQQERNRLARELHDSIKQQIFTIGVSAAAAQARWESDLKGARTAVDDVRNSAHEAMVEMEAMLQHLRPAPLETVGLVEALRKQCEALQYRTGAKVTSEFMDIPENDQLPTGAQEAIFRIAQESIANIARHARAKNVTVRLSADAETESMIFQVRDDGQGFSPVTVTEGMGMANIRARTQEIGGRLELLSQPGSGARLTIYVPLLRTAEREARRHFALGALNALAAAVAVGLIFAFSWIEGNEIWVIVPFALPLLIGAISQFLEVRKIAKSSPRILRMSQVLPKKISDLW
jgi:signal transduction histidine kinase